MESTVATFTLTSLPYQDRTQGVYNVIGADLNRGAESGNEGILPTKIDSSGSLRTTFSVSITANTPEKLKDLTEGLNARVQKQDTLARNILTGL